MTALSHEQALQLLHEAPRQLTTDQQANLAAHLAECDQCRSYADQLTVLRPLLTQALHTRRYPDSTDGEIVPTILQRKRRSTMRKKTMTVVATVVIAAFAIMVISSTQNSAPLLTGAQRTATPAPATMTSPSATPTIAATPTLAPAPVEFPKIDRRPAVADWGRVSMTSVPTYNPTSDEMWQMDLRSYDLSRLDLSHSLNDLLFADFDTQTKWPPAAKMPAGFDWQRIMELGKNPGLGIRQLHVQGITGKGVGIAIIDQTLLVDHQEYKDHLRLYEEASDIQGGWLESQMHGPAVASIAVGKTVGVAPGADLYYIASGMCNTGTYESVDFACLAQSIRRILEINQQLPRDRKIRVLSMSVGWGPQSKGYQAITAAVQDAKAAGILVVSSSLEETFGFKFHGLGRAPLADPDKFESYEPGMFWAKDFYDNPKDRFSDRLLVPMDSRTTASPGGPQEYVFDREGGWSWSIPYIAGVYALAAQVKPSITPDEFWSLALKTGRTVQLKRNGETIAFGPILDPVALIESLPTAATTPGPSGPTPSDVDRFEPNDDFAHATPIELNVKYDQLNFAMLKPNADGWDSDYFQVRVKPGMLITCHTSDLSGGANTNLILYDNSLNGIEGNDDVDRANNDLSSSVTYTTTYEGWLYVLVGEGVPRSPAEAQQATYSIECVTPSAATTPVPPSPIPSGVDRFEPNDEFDQAALIVLNVKYDQLNFAMLTPSADGWDNDFFKVRVKPGMLVTCRTSDLSAGTDTNLILYDQYQIS